MLGATVRNLRGARPYTPPDNPARALRRGLQRWLGGMEAPDSGEWGAFGNREVQPAFTPVAFNATVAGTEGIFCPWTDPVGSILQETTTAPTNGQQLTSTSISGSGLTVTFTG